jgi:hypothetical protein
MAKIKIRGANPSQPPAPIVCSASMFAMLMKRFRFDSQKDQHDAGRRVLALCILPQDFSLPQAGDSFASGMHRGRRTMVLLLTAPQKEVGPCSQAQ